MRTLVSLANESLGWYRAVTLSERLVGRAPITTDAWSEPIERAEANRGRLHYCMSSWRSQRPFHNAEQFQQRLALDKLTESELRRLICEPVADIREHLSTVPDWVATIEAALSSTPSANTPAPGSITIRGAGSIRARPSRPSVRVMYCV